MPIPVANTPPPLFLLSLRRTSLRSVVFWQIGTQYGRKHCRAGIPSSTKRLLQYRSHLSPKYLSKHLSPGFGTVKLACGTSTQSFESPSNRSIFTQRSMSAHTDRYSIWNGYSLHLVGVGSVIVAPQQDSARESSGEDDDRHDGPIRRAI